MSFGKSTQSMTPELSPEQKAQIAAQTEFFTGTIKPTYEQAVKGATELYNVNAPGALKAGQNLAGTAGQVQSSLGETGESALRTGISGLQSLFTPDYERSQILNAITPAQGQFRSNVADLKRQFGGIGNLGSARQALAERQLAGATQAAQAQTAAKIQQDIAQQRAGVAAQLAGIGQTNLGGAVNAAGQRVAAAQVPQDLYNKYASVIFGTPAGSYNPNFAGTQGQTSTGMSLGLKYQPF
jgi:hypothetical protein